MEALDELARRCGIEAGYWDIAGIWHTTSADTSRALLAAMGVDAGSPGALAAGLERVRPSAAVPHPTARCLLPADLGIGRAWGVTCQAYGLRSRRAGDVGDLEDVARLAEVVGRQQGDFLGLNPLHALFPADATRYSPYAPSSRRWLNIMVIAVDMAVADLAIAVPDGVPATDQSRDLVSYPEVQRAKMAALKSLWHEFKAAHLAGSPSAAGAAFADWRARQGLDLELHCRFHAIALHLAATSDPSPWWVWPDGLDVAASAAVDRFAAAHADEVAFLAFLQWLADRQLEAAQARALAAGMRVGLYRDMAIGVVPDGSAAWAEPGVTVRGATAGSPPDAFSPLGQNWNVAPISPLALRERALEPLLADLRAAMRHAGAVRIDHAMGLMRLFWIPAGGTPADGAYVRYPFAEALAAVARESHERRCLVVGEDLGTVPEGFREPMNEAGILSCKVLWFERWQDGLFKAPDAYDARALATISTHDLSTVRGFFGEVDLAWRERLGLYPDKEQAAQERQRRATAVEQLRGALRYAGLPADTEDPDLIAEALHRYLARTPSWLLGAQLEDLVGETEQPNLPGTIDEHPNWRRRIPLPVEDLAHHPLARRIIEALRQERPRD